MDGQTQLQFHREFERSIRVGGNRGCWTWIGYSAGVGDGRRYGRIRLPGKGKYVYAHRVSWELHYGPIPNGIYVCHHCDNGLCVNPEHLFLGTNSDNIKDAYMKGRTKAPIGVRGSDNHNSKLTESKVREIRERRRRGEKYRTIARDLSVTANAACSAALGRTWGWLR